MASSLPSRYDDGGSHSNGTTYSSRSMPEVRDVLLNCYDGIQIAGQSYVKMNKKGYSSEKATVHRVLCLHGWLDNCRSFHYLAPELTSRLADSDSANDVHVVTVDLPGHGLSSHKSLDGPAMVYTENIYYVTEILKQLKWIPNIQNNKITLIGHSMGAGIACIYAAAFPEHIRSVVLLDGAGPIPNNAEDIALSLRNHITKRLNGNRQICRKKVQNLVCDSLDAAIEMRCRQASHFSGDQYLSKEAARELVLRSSTTTYSQKVVFRHDPRLQWPFVQNLTLEQITSMYKNMRCPTLLLLAEDGFPQNTESITNMLKPTKMKTLPGSHHFHADPQTASDVVNEILLFLFYTSYALSK